MTIRTDRTDVPLAIIGMACRLPCAENLQQYWDLIVNGRSAVIEVPAERLDQQLYYDPQRGVRGKTYSKMAALLGNREFDASRCPIPDELRESVDNTHLLMTGVVADALRHAALDPFDLPLRNTAVFIGHAQGSSRLGELTLRANLDDAASLLDETDGFQQLPLSEQAAIRRELVERIRCRLPVGPANSRDLNCNMVAGTIAKAFGLSGPWLALNSACASSLHAMLLGARALQRGRADMAIVGGASDCKSDSLVLFSHAQAMSASASRPFDADADGLIMSEGYVALVMKTLERALADGDPVQAVVRGLGVATDGRGKSLWAPRKEGQIRAMRSAYRKGVDVSRLEYLECHATATQLGDATELETLGEVLGAKFPAGKRIPITSVKANIGHSLEAAGIAGVIKTVLCMQHRTIPPAINVRTLNPKVDWDKAPFYVPLEAQPWGSPADGRARRAAVNAFGIGGLNMHVVLDEFTESIRSSGNGTPAGRAESADDRAIAIVGMSCILPGASNLKEFWEMLLAGHDPKGPPPANRWSPLALARQERRGGRVIGGFIRDYQYDWRKHKVPPKQVAEADPLQFMLLDVSQQALIDAGHDRDSLDRESCGVVVGTEFGGDFCDQLEMGLRLPEMQQILGDLLERRGVPAERISDIKAGFSDVLLKKWPSLIDETGSFTSSTLASRISKTLDLAGGAVSIDSGSTSALSALSLCVDALLSGDNDLMICAAGQRRMGPAAYEALETAGLLSAAAVPRAVFDAAYDGILPAEGAGAVVLKRLADARRDGDRVYAIIRGLGIAHHESPAEAMRLAIGQSFATSGIDPAAIRMAEVDTDETPGSSGDEFQALAFRRENQGRNGPLEVSALAAQLGHLGGAAGMAALIKASLELSHGQIAPTFGLADLAPALSRWSESIRPARTAESISGRRLGALACWSKGQAFHLILEYGLSVAGDRAVAADDSVVRPAEQTRLPAAVSGGRSAAAVTNARVTTVAPPRQLTSPAAAAPSAARVFRLGNSSLEQLRGAVERAQRDPVASWNAAGASSFGPADRVRLALVAGNPGELARKLKLAEGQLQNPAARTVLDQQGIFYREVPPVRPRVAFVFPGQGSQYDGMLRELVRDLPAAAAAVSQVDATLKRLGYPTFAQLAWAERTRLGEDVWETQLSMLLADAICLAAVRACRIAPDLVLGHSYGEFVALLAAGAWDLETAARMTKARCDGIRAAARGDAGLLATNAAPEVVEQLAANAGCEVYLANLNAPDQTVVGGKRDQLENVAAALEVASHQARILAVPAPFHTPLMAGASRLLELALQGFEPQPLQTVLVSTVSNRRASDASQIRRNLIEQLTTPIYYARLIAHLAAEEPTVFVEVGPQQTLTRLNRRIVDAATDAIACDNPKRPGIEPLLGVQALLECLGALGDTDTAPRSDRSSFPQTTVPLSTPPTKEPVSNATMNDQIPHFDATERRRAKMRSASSDPAPHANGGTPGVIRKPASTPSIPVPVPAPPRGVSPAPTPSPAPVPTPAPAPVARRAVSEPAPASAPTGNDNGTAATTPVSAAPAKPASPAAPLVSPRPVEPPQPRSATPKSVATPAAELESFLVNFVVEQTGYPPEVVELDADLEADLGIDSIKKAQLFGELQEYFDIGAAATTELSLDDFPTLRHVLDFLASQGSVGMEREATRVDVPPPEPPASDDARTRLPTDPSIVPAAPSLAHQVSVVTALPPQDPVPAKPAGGTASGSLTAAGPPVASSRAELESFLVNFVVEQTGYPPEVVELDADLEADLGIDSIKKAQLFGELQEYFDIGAAATSELSLDDFPTLRHVLDFLASQGSVGMEREATRVDMPPPEPPVSDDARTRLSTDPPVVPAASSIAHQASVATALPPDPVPPAVTSSRAELESFLVNFVVEQTGYPPEVVELDADLEADLGIDSIKKAQLFGELQEYFDIGAAATGELSLDDFPTLRHVLDFLASQGSGGTEREATQADTPASDDARMRLSAEPPVVPAAPSLAHQAGVVTALPPPDSVPPGEAAGASSPAELESFLVNFVVEQTGYPPEVVELDADLEADLGIDSIKKAQLFGELQEYFDIGAAATTELALDDFPTLRHVLDFLVNQSSASPASSRETQSNDPTSPFSSAEPAPAAEQILDEPAPGVVSQRPNATDATQLDTFLDQTTLAQPSLNGKQPAEAEAVVSSTVVRLAGTPYEMGWQHGEHFKAEIQRILRRYAERTCDMLDELPGPSSPAVLQELLSPDELDELQGLADAVEVPLGNVLAHHFAVSAELGAESGQLAVAPANGGPGRLVHAFRQPLPVVSALREAAYPVVFLREPVRGRAHLALSYVGSVSQLGGINSAGIAVSAFPIARRQGQGAGGSRTATTVVRRTLEKAADLDAALAILGECNGVAPWCGCLSHAPSDRIAHVEFDGARLSIRTDEQAYATGELNADFKLSTQRAAVTGRPSSSVGAAAVAMPALAPSSALVQQLAGSFHAAGPVTKLAERATAGEADCVAMVMEPALGCVWLGGAGPNRSVVPLQIATTPLFTSSSSCSAHELADEVSGAAAKEADPSDTDVTRRFVLEMRAAPLPPDAATQPEWNGAAIVLGANATAEALRNRLRQAGVTVHQLRPDADVDSALEQLESICRCGPAPHLFVTTGRDDMPLDAADDALWKSAAHEAMVVPFFVCQKWLQLASEGKWIDRCTLVATISAGGDFGFQRGAESPQGGALSGLLKAIFIEYTVMQGLRNLRVKIVDAPWDETPDSLVTNIFGELASGNLDYEVAFVGGDRLVPYAVQRDCLQRPEIAGIRPGATWVVTGGARGITAACALELARRYRLRLHLIGTSPLPQIDPAWCDLDGPGLQQLKAATMIAARKAGRPAAQAWEKVEKELEIDRSLRAFVAAGVHVAYHTCDVADREALAGILDAIRQADGPIEGVLHGAGIDRSCRFERKQRDVVLRTIGAKVDGAANLMALTRRDPVRHFIGFGSISGRLGSFGQTDYCLASDMLCKLIGAYRRSRPWIKAVGFHWHPWDEVGMAARPETRNVLQRKSDLRLMPLAEGIAHLLREIAAGLPDPEVLITEQRHWERFASGLGTLAERPERSPGVPAPAASAAAASAPTSSPLQTVESEAAAEQPAQEPQLLTHRCELATLPDPLPPGLPDMPNWDSAVWILGQNDVACAAAARLEQAGVRVEQLSSDGDADQVLAEMERLWGEQPAKYLFLMTGRDAPGGDLLESDQMRRRRDAGILLPFFVAQRWCKLLATRPDLGPAILAAAVSLGGDFGFRGGAPMPDGGAVCGLLKAIHIENSRRETVAVRCKVFDAPPSEPPAKFAEAMFRELAADRPEVEVCWSAGERRVVRPLPAPLRAASAKPIPRGGTWLVTGGARGITAIAARQLARRYGWKLHLLGKSPPPQAGAVWRNYSDAEMKSLKSTLAREAVTQGRSPAEAWDRVMKDVEIDKNLREFAEAGVTATYHSCDITDREAVARVLDEVRRQDGSIQGILHGAGLIDPGRFENKRRGFVKTLIRTKFDGLINLLALTRQDPLAYCIGFGSISGRFGGNGLADYAAGNDALAKLIDWVRLMRPECAATCIHWESWEGSGMATLPRFAWGPKAIMNMKYMMPEEGVRRLEQELQAGLPASEVLYTFGDFYPMFYPAEQRPLGPFMPGQCGSTANENVEPKEKVEPARPLLRGIRREPDGCVGEMPLDPIADTFLVQHRLRDKPLLPVVVGLEALCEAAAAASGKQAVGFRNVQMQDGLHFHTDRSVTANVRATLQGDDDVDCRLVCDFRNRSGGLIQKDRPYLRAVVQTASQPAALTANLPGQPGPWTEFAYPDGQIVYHGPAFRGVTATCFERRQGWGRITSLPLAELVGAARVAGWQLPSCVLDAAFYVCGIHLWVHGERAISLPKAIDRLQFGRMPRNGETCLAYFTCREISAAAACYDFTVVGEDRSVILDAQGYHKVILARGGGP